MSFWLSFKSVSKCTLWQSTYAELTEYACAATLWVKICHLVVHVCQPQSGGVPFSHEVTSQQETPLTSLSKLRLGGKNALRYHAYQLFNQSIFSLKILYNIYWHVVCCLYAEIFIFIVILLRNLFCSEKVCPTISYMVDQLWPQWFWLEILETDFCTTRRVVCTYL